MPETIGMSNFNLPAGSRVEMLGVKGRLKWENNGDRLFSYIPIQTPEKPTFRPGMGSED